MTRFPWGVFGILGLLLFISGQYLGLSWAPPDQHMGDVSRILYVHVPAAWISMLMYTVALFAGLGTLFSGLFGRKTSNSERRKKTDAVLEAAVEVGAVLNALLLMLGSIFARPTFGVWWDWDPRLTLSLVMWLMFLGVIILRSLIEDSDQRALTSGAAVVLAWATLPLVYFSVRWWRSIHQVQSSPSTMSPEMVLALRWNAVALLFLAIWMVATRARVALRRAEQNSAPPLVLP